MGIRAIFVFLSENRLKMLHSLRIARISGTKFTKRVRLVKGVQYHTISSLISLVVEAEAERMKLIAAHHLGTSRYHEKGE